MINRGVVIVRPNKPYIDWAASLDEMGHEINANDEQNVYLIPNFENEAEAWETLNEVYSTIFDNELFGWHTDAETWPQERTLEMFKKWFNVELHPVVEDLCAYELVNEEDDDEEEEE